MQFSLFQSETPTSVNSIKYLLISSSTFCKVWVSASASASIPLIQNSVYLMLYLRRCRKRQFLIIVYANSSICINKNNNMSQSEDQGFQVFKQQTLFLKLPFRNKNESSGRVKSSKPMQMVYKSPVCLHHELLLYEYPKEIDSIQSLKNESECITAPDTQPQIQPLNEITLQNDINSKEFSLLSEYFPRKYICVYNKFHQNLLLKRDMTILIRNISKRVKSEALATFHDIQRNFQHSPITFSSDFECGNLHSVFRDKKNNVFYLFIQNDVNTHGYNQWFYFNVVTLAQMKCRFIIVNISKEIKFFEGLRLVTYSNEHKFKRQVNFLYYENKFMKFSGEKYYYCIDFEYEFLKENEEIYFSLALPYSYSKMLRMIKQNQKKSTALVSVQVELVGKSDIGNLIPMIKIYHRQKKSKKAIFILARQHPSESVGSFIAQEIIKHLLSQENAESTVLLLELFSFYIIPMVNPDGVIHGNSRTNLYGYDLNRCWEKSYSSKSNECDDISNFIDKISQKESIQYVIDLHGHSRELGCFAYFTENTETSKIMSHTMKKHCPFFNYHKCQYNLTYDKRQSLRGQMYLRMRVRNSITIQTSFYGYRDQNQQLILYTLGHFKLIATGLLSSFFKIEELKNHQNRNKILKQIDQDLQQSEEKRQNASQKSIDSDSNPQDDYLMINQRNLDQSIIPKKHTNKRAKTEHSIRSEQNFKKQFQKEVSCIQGQKKIVNIFKNQKCIFLKKKQGSFHVPLSVNKKNNTITNNFLKGEIKTRKKIYSHIKEEIPNYLRYTSLSNSMNQNKIRSIQGATDECQTMQKSIDMRKKLKSVFQYNSNQQKIIRKTMLGNFKAKNSRELEGVKTIVYPTESHLVLDIAHSQSISKLKNNLLKINIKNKIKSVRQTEYGKSFTNMFNRTCMMKNPRQK